MPSPAGIAVRPFALADLPQARAYDRPLSGMERPAILAHLATRQPGLAWVAEDGVGQDRGLRAGPRRADRRPRSGRWWPTDEATALALIAKAASSARGPVHHRRARGASPRSGGWLEAQGAVSPRGYMRMTLGAAKGLDDPSHVFALAGPELG